MSKMLSKVLRTCDPQRILGATVVASDREKLQTAGIIFTQHLVGSRTAAIEQLFSNPFALEWDLLVFTDYYNFEDESQLLTLLSLIQESDGKSVTFLNGYAESDDPFVIDESNVAYHRDTVRKRIRDKHKKLNAVYADSEEDLGQAVWPLGNEVRDYSIQALKSGEIEGLKGFEFFGACSKVRPNSTIQDAISYVCEAPNRILVVSSLDLLADSPSELQKVLERINTAESGISVKFLEWTFFHSVSRYAPPVDTNLIIGNQLDDLVNGVGIVASFSQMFHGSGQGNGNSKVPSKDYQLILEHMKNGLTQNWIAKELGVSRATISRHVAQMKKEGYLPLNKKDDPFVHLRG